MKLENSSSANFSSIFACESPEFILPDMYPSTVVFEGGSVAEWLACWTQALKGPGSNRSRDAVG